MTGSVYFDEGEDFDHNSEAYSCLLDVMSIQLTEMDLYSAQRVDGRPSQCLSGDCLPFRGYYLLKDNNRPLRDRSECIMGLSSLVIKPIGVICYGVVCCIFSK